MTSSSLRRLALAGSFLLSCSLSGVAASAEQGERWQTTTQTTAEWIPINIPAQRARVCAEKDWTKPPGGAGQNCQLSDVKVDGPRITWKQRCAGPPEMTGTGEITRTADSYRGVLRMNSDRGIMTVKMSGQKTGTCDDPQ